MPKQRALRIASGMAVIAAGGGLAAVTMTTTQPQAELSALGPNPMLQEVHDGYPPTEALVVDAAPPAPAPIPEVARAEPVAEDPSPTVPAPRVTVAYAAPPVPVAPASSGGTWWDLAICESGAVASTNTGNGYYGAFQFAATTWWGMGEDGYASDYPYAYQQGVAQRLQARSGWGQWPACARRLGLL